MTWTKVISTITDTDHNDTDHVISTITDTDHNDMDHVISAISEAVELSLGSCSGRFGLLPDVVGQSQIYNSFCNLMPIYGQDNSILKTIHFENIELNLRTFEGTRTEK